MKAVESAKNVYFQNQKSAFLCFSFTRAGAIPKTFSKTQNAYKTLSLNKLQAHPLQKVPKKITKTTAEIP